jgi:tetratricopeptide (TPR) repeat protein
MNRKMMKIGCLILCGSFLLFVVNCSTANYRPGWTKQGGPNKAIPKEVTQFLKTVRSPGGNPDSHYLLACYYQERGKHPEAIQEFIKVISIDPAYVKAYNGMGISYDFLKDFPQAVACYQKAIQLNPNLDYIQNNLGYSYLLQGKFDEAISALKRAVALNEGERRLHNNLGLAYASSGQLDLALNEFKLAGEPSRAHYNVARFYQEKGLFQLAQFHYATALKLDPSFSYARVALNAVNVLARIFGQIPQEEKLKDEDEKEPEAFLFGKIEPEKPDSSTFSVNCERSTPQSDLPVGRSDWNGEMDEEQIHLSDATARTEFHDVPLRTGEPQKFQEPVSLEKPSMKTEASLSLDQSREDKPSTSLKGIGIEISNGNGMNGMARRVGHYLTERGIEVNRLTNASQFNHSETKLYYQKGYQEAASHLAEQLPIPNEMKEEKRFERPNIRIKVLIGKDLVPYDKLFREDKRS